VKLGSLLSKKNGLEKIEAKMYTDHTLTSELGSARDIDASN
jgi:hypothetical protein